MSGEVNVPLLRKAVEWAEAEVAKPPEVCEWNQRDVHVEPAEFVDYFGVGVKAQGCGTCYCIAGFVAASIGATGDRWSAAGVALGLDFDQECDLFAPDNTIEDVRRIAEELAGERL